jgi:electron transfer flavoprotein beta subunit
MKILTCLKQVPARDSQLKIDGAARGLDESDLTFEMNEPDAYALEEALQLKEALQLRGKPGGEVVALCAGPERAASSIREALAKGADRAIHIECEDLAAWDGLGVARLLAAAAKQEQPDLILTGLQSDDLGLGQTGVILAELLGFAHASLVMAVEVTDGGLRVKRELEDGWFQHVDLPLPAVLTIQSGGNRLRYATLMGITKELKAVPVAELGVANDAAALAERVYAPNKAKQTVMLTGTAKEQAAQLVEKLTFEARVF